MKEVSAVEVDNLTYRYADRTALDGISFTVARGEIFGLLGPNGGGKTTLFRILSTLLVPDGGSARVFGLDVRLEPQAVRRRIGVVFQNQSLDRRLSPAENLSHQGHLYGLRGLRSLSGRPRCSSASGFRIAATTRWKVSPGACAGGSS